MTKATPRLGEQQADYHKDFEHLAKLIEDIKIAMLTTRDEDGTLRSRPMGTQSADEFDGTVHFFTDIDSHKTLEVEDNRRVNVSYAQPSGQKYVSLSGTARITQDRAELEAHWSPSVKIWFKDGLDDPKIALLSIDVSKAEYWDSPSKPVLLFEIARSAITGEPLDPGEDKQLDLKSRTSREAVRH